MDPNVYAPSPAALSAQPSDVFDLSTCENAQRWRRFVTVLIDTACIYVLAIILAIILALISREALSAMEQYAFVIGYGLQFLYYLPFEGVWGRTIGKFATGTRVIDVSGSPASFGQVVRRTFIRCIPFEAFSFLSSRPRGLHDRWSDTRVVLIRQ